MFRFKKTIFAAVAATTIAVMGLLFFSAPADAGSGRDCDGNAVIYCGAYSTSELRNKINNGTGKKYQSAAELKALYGKYDVYTGDFGHLVSGRVTKTNKVYVGSKVVASKVYSMGRHKTANSVDVKGISYPLWLRHPSESFVSSSIDAFVYLNYDGSMAYAVIKSCGNIVPGVGKRTKPNPTYYLEVRKFNDANRNNQKESSESYLANWRFHITGPNTDKYVTTNSNGAVRLTGLKPGTYHITETIQPNWYATSSISKTITISTANRVVEFANYYKEPEKFVDLSVVKYNDLNANAIEDDNEYRMSGWQFRVVGPNVNTVLATDETGQAALTHLKPGIYTVTEINKTGWESTTGLSVRRDVTLDPSTQTFIFGNKEIPHKPPVVPPGGGEIKKLTSTGPVETAAGGVASAAIAGGVLSWVRSRRLLKGAFRK
jgi:hypothetical protein